MDNVKSKYIITGLCRINHHRVGDPVHAHPNFLPRSLMSILDHCWQVAAAHSDWQAGSSSHKIGS